MLVREDAVRAIAGAGAGMTCCIVCAPLDLLRLRIQVAPSHFNHPEYRHGSLRSQLHNIVQTEGVAGLFRGVSASIITVPLFWTIYFPCVPSGLVPSL